MSCDITDLVTVCDILSLLAEETEGNWQRNSAENIDLPAESIYVYFVLLRYITKTCLYNFDPLKPHFYIVKLGFTGVYIIFLISAQKHRMWVLIRTTSLCGYSLELPRRGSSNEYPQSMFLSRNMKISKFFIWKFSVFGGEISIYLNRHVFVMVWKNRAKFWLEFWILFIKLLNTGEWEGISNCNMCKWNFCLNIVIIHRTGL